MDSSATDGPRCLDNPSLHDPRSVELAAPLLTSPLWVQRAPAGVRVWIRPSPNSTLRYTVVLVYDFHWPSIFFKPTVSPHGELLRAAHQAPCDCNG